MIKNTLLGGTDFSTPSDRVKPSDLNDTFDEVAERIEGKSTFNLAPIGSVFAWMKSLTNTPTLPANWVECNGQVLSDADSVYNGVTIPDLNSAVDTGLKGQFLRGHTSSGVTETSQNLSHTHDTVIRKNSNTNGTGIEGSSESVWSASQSGNTVASGGDEARPYNYSVVWIMRIK